MSSSSPSTETSTCCREELITASCTAARGAPAGGRLVLDLSPVTFMDSAGLEAVLTCLRSAHRAGLQVALAVRHPAVAQLFTLNGIQQAFPVVHGPHAALAPPGPLPDTSGRRVESTERG